MELERLSYLSSAQNFKFSNGQKKNSHFILTDDSTISLGSGGAGFGLWIDNDFLRGSSSPCETFMNSCLASSEQFKCLDIEIWGLEAYK